MLYLPDSADICSDQLFLRALREIS